MAKDHYHTHQISHKLIASYNHDNSKSSPDNSETERVFEHRSVLSKDFPNTPTKALDKLAQKISLEYPFTLTDGNKRTWIFKDAFGEPVEYLGYPPGLSSYRRHLVLADNLNTSDQDILEESPSNWDPSELGLDWEPHTPGAIRCSRETAKKKRFPSAIRCPPSKRMTYSSSPKQRRIPYTVQEDGESDTTDEGESGEEEDEFAGATFENQGVRIGELRGTMVDILKKLHQKGLKQVLKAILRKCHPQKQANFPYNGGKLQEQERINGNPDYDEMNPGLLTAPDYWLHQDDWKPQRGHVPTGCRHREPDHIYKPERINLTMHLLHAGDRYQDAKFSLDKLRESTMNITNNYPKAFQPDAESLIEALYYAREKEIQYENGEIDADTVVYVPMPVQRSSKPKRIMRNKKVVTKVKQDTPETSGFFELCTPSANSSFTSSFNNTVKVESGSSSPFPGAAPSHIDAIVADSNTSVKRLAFQASSYPSTSASDDLGATHSDKRTPAPVEGDTEVDSLDGIANAGGPLKQVESQSLTPRTASQLAVHNMSSLDGVVATTIEDLPTSVGQTVPTFRHGLPTPDLHSSSVCNMSIAERQAVGSTYVNPADTYAHPCNDNHVFSNHTANITNTTYPILTPTPAAYFTFHNPHDNHPTAPPPTPMLAHSIGPNPLLNGYPSRTSSDFNGPMPTDPDWHTVDISYEHFHTGNYQQQQQQHSLPFTSAEGPPAVQQGDGGNDGRFWAGDFDAMAHEPGASPVQPGVGAMSRTSSAEGGPMQQQQIGRYAYPFSQQQSGGGRGA